MDKNQKVLSDIIVFSKYARFIPELGRRENWEDIVLRNMQMHTKRFPDLTQEIRKVYKDFVIPKKVLPSMRSLQFGGESIERSPSRIYNCSFLHASTPDAFSETMFLLLGGTGVGYSVQKHHVDQLPIVKGPKKTVRRYLIPDCIEGWADAVKMLVESYFYNKQAVKFDFSSIRKKGSPLVTTGGKAPGPQPLKDCLHNLEGVLNASIGRKLKPVEVHDMLCFEADAVLAGGIRRSACISLFSLDDIEMMNCKQGSWWEQNPQRGRSNNSVVLERDKVTEAEFKAVLKRTELSKAGEPGITFTDDKEYGLNPCAEISLVNKGFCNLTEANADGVKDQEDLNSRVKAAAFIGTLQAAYTDFHYLSPEWKENAEEEALLGVSLTGIAAGDIFALDLKEAAEEAKKENERVAGLIGINKAARVTCVKPSGTASLCLGTSSGIHAFYNDYYIRRMRLNKDEPLYGYIKETNPELVEDDFFRPDQTAVLSIPLKAPLNATLRSESAMDMLERVKKFNVDWVHAGHRQGANYNNVSCTVSLKDDEWDKAGQWMWDNRNTFTGISVLPYDSGTYQQPPFEDCTKEVFDRMSELVNDINLDDIKEDTDMTNLTGEAACSGGQCEIK